MIELDHICKSFDGAYAVRDVNLSVAGGEFVAIVGGSGSGKTTTLKTLNRLIEIDAGSIRIEGKPIASMPAPLLRRRIGYVFQGIGLFPHMTVAENICITPRLLGWSSRDIQARLDELLSLIELPPAMANRFPHALSGGQRQRVGIARALAAKPKIMLMDEPFGALDPLTRHRLGSEYRRLHDQLQLTTVMITHDVSEAVLLADRMVVMRAGEIVTQGTPHQLLTQQTDADVQQMMDLPRRQAQRVQELMT